MAQNENKKAMNQNTGFEQGKKPFSQKPGDKQMPEQPERWSPDEDESTEQREEDVRGTHQNPRKY